MAPAVSETGRARSLADWIPALGDRFDRVVYTAQQRSLALSLGIGARLWTQLIAPGLAPPSVRSARELRRRFDALIERDLDNVRRGVYPRKLLYQMPVGQYLSRVPEAVADAPRFLWRSYFGKYDDVPASAPGDYPPYYLRTFHWQTDGWLSARSARLYDASVELLFGGTADVMRRMAIPPIAALARRQSRPLRILDVGCGTGRFLKQLNAALPEARLYGRDLSKQYLGEARRQFGHEEHVSFVVENAEALPFGDGYFDVVTSIFLFHELPKPVRRTVSREIARVLAPGGKLVVCDSAQVSDSGEIEDVLRGFPRSYHEPFYLGYLKDDLGEMFRSCGFSVDLEEPHLVSKIVVAGAPGRRPQRRRSSRKRASSQN